MIKLYRKGNVTIEVSSDEKFFNIHKHDHNDRVADTVRLRSPSSSTWQGAVEALPDEAILQIFKSPRAEVAKGRGSEQCNDQRYMIEPGYSVSRETYVSYLYQCSARVAETR